MYRLLRRSSVFNMFTVLELYIYGYYHWFNTWCGLYNLVCMILCHIHDDLWLYRHLGCHFLGNSNMTHKHSYFGATMYYTQILHHLTPDTAYNRYFEQLYIVITGISDAQWL